MLETVCPLSNTGHSFPHILLFIDTFSTRTPIATGEDLYNVYPGRQNLANKQLACELLRIVCSHHRNAESVRYPPFRPIPHKDHTAP
ncbi:hypothetical protein HYQ44_000219 [Verticillium longisporum]|nr:hypothetical protein HYQ44_000219 [Verticillium longisporum]